MASFVGGVGAVARNPDADSSLLYLVRIQLVSAGVVLKTRDTWPRTRKVYCLRADAWPADAETVERVPVRSCAWPRSYCTVPLALAVIADDALRLQAVTDVVAATSNPGRRPAGRGEPRGRFGDVADLVSARMVERCGASSP